MKRVDTEPQKDRLPASVKIVRERRRSVELGMSHGELVARVPHRISRAELAALLQELRADMNAEMARERILDDDELDRAAETVRARWLADLPLPTYSVRFAGRMRKRWASCSVDAGGVGSIRVSRLLRGHPRWLLEHLLLHELIHLRIPNHGPHFRTLLARSPHGERADGYLEALEHREQWGQWLQREGESARSEPARSQGKLAPAQIELSFRAPENSEL